MANTPYITEKTEAEMNSMAALEGIDEGRLYDITDLDQRVMGINGHSWVILYPTQKPALMDFDPVVVVTPSGKKKVPQTASK
jgi:hypothetical protein